MKKIIICSLFLLFICSCSSNTENISTKGIVSCQNVEKLIKEQDAVLIDVRTDEEYDTGHKENAINIDYQEIEKIEELSISLDTPIIVYCKSGKRSSVAKEQLEKLGYTKVYDMGAMNNCK